MLVNIRMPTFKNTLDILSNPWSNEFSQENAYHMNMQGI